MYQIIIHPYNIGLIGQSTNFYVYAQNSPLNVKDPTGKILPLAPLVVPLLIRSTLGAAESVVFDVGLSLLEGKLPTVKGTNNIQFLLLYDCRYCLQES